MRTIASSLMVGIAAAVGIVLPGPVSASTATPTPAPTATYCPALDAYEVTPCGAQPALPASGPIAPALDWALRQLAGEASSVTSADVSRHVAAGMLAQPGTSADELVTAFQDTVSLFGPLMFHGFAYPPRSQQAVALVQSATGVRAEVPISVTAAGLIDSLSVNEATPVLVPRGRLSGWFDVGHGRQMFLRCTGHGSPTVVFENGLTADWFEMQKRVTPLTRTCSYDPARQNGPSSRSDSAAAPRTADDRVRDLHALLAAADVPGPYVLAGQSNGGLFSLVYASRFPGQVAGMVLIDGVHPAYHRRMFAALKHLVPPEQQAAARAQFCAVPTRYVDWERMDICRAERQARRQLETFPLRAMPLAVLSHGVPEGRPGAERRISERVWQQLQRELAALVPGATHTIARRSGHDIQHTQPALVERAITHVVDAVRDRRTTTRR